MTVSQFVHDVNCKRRSWPTWFWWSGIVEGKEVLLKAHGTWVQLAEVDGVKSTGPMDCSVKDFKIFLRGLV